jgi:hypothetical protein
MRGAIKTAHVREKERDARLRITGITRRFARGGGRGGEEGGGGGEEGWSEGKGRQRVSRRREEDR